MPLLTCPHCGSAVTALDIETAPLRCPVCGAALTRAPEPAAPAPGEPEPAPVALPIREAEVRDASYHSGWQDREGDDSATRIARDRLERLEPISAQAHTAPSYDGYDGYDGADEATRALPHASGAPNDASEPREPLDATHALPLSAIPQQAPVERHAPRLRALSIALATLALVIVIVVATLVGNGLLPGLLVGGPAPVPTATIAPTATPSRVAFTEPGRYTLSFPQGWLKTERNSAPQSYFALLSSGGSASVDVEAQQLGSAPDLAALDEQTISALAQPGTTPTNLSAATSVTIGGQAWQRVAGDAQLLAASGQPATYGHVVAYSTQRGAYTYTILCISAGASADAARAAFTTDDQSAFQPLLASFTFVG